MTAMQQIAIVDDDASVRKALTRLLAATEYGTAAYCSVDEFLAALAGGSPQCLLIDYQMPKMTGLALQTHLNAIGVHLPIIVITAHDEASIRESCIKSGVSAFLTKPIRKKTLLTSIRHAIKDFGAGA